MSTGDHQQPSAFVPFCAFQSSMAGLGKPVTEGATSLPACDIFYPAMLQGQLCYRLNTSRLGGRSGGKGVKSSLMLMLDINEERSPGILKKHMLRDSTGSRLDLSLVPRWDQAMVHIQTLSPFTGFGPGHYKMSALKQTTGSEEFLSLEDDKKRCQVELEEKCVARLWKDAIKEKCKCWPLALAALPEKVWLHF